MAVAGEFGRHRLYKMLGYFSLVGLLRLHSLLGDYHQALRVIDNMNVNRKVTYVYFLPSDSQRTLMWEYAVHVLHCSVCHLLPLLRYWEMRWQTTLFYI